MGSRPFTNFDNLIVSDNRAPLLTNTPTPTAAPTVTPTAVPSETITFDDLSNPNRPLNGAYPSGGADWGNNAWHLSGPWGRFTTNSVMLQRGWPDERKHGLNLTDVSRAAGWVQFVGEHRHVRLQRTTNGFDERAG